MGWKFNPFTGALDQTGSTPASYIDAEVATYNDLPLSSTTAPLDSAWLVRGSSGVWPFTKPGGVYVRTATGGSSRDADYTYAGVFPDVFSDANFTLYDDSDTSKNLKFQLSGVTTGTTRTLTVPNASGTIARTQDFAAPPAIGSTSPAAGSFSTLSANSTISATAGTGQPPTSLANAKGVQFSGINAAVYGTYNGFPAVGIGVGDGPMTEVASFQAASMTLNKPLIANNGTITASAPVLDLSQTWNNAAVTFRGVNWSFVETAAVSTSEVFRISAGAAGTAAIFNIRRDGNATFGNGVNVGTVGGNAVIAGQNGQWRVSSGGAFGFCDAAANAYGTMDTAIFRDAADTLAMRRLANPQAFRLYNTTDSSVTNFERGFMRWSSNVLQIGTEKGGTGSARALEFQTDGTTRLTISAGGSVTAAGTLIGGPIQSNSHVRVAAVSQLEFGSSGSRISNQSSGVLTLHDSALSDFGRLQFGGTTSSFPALKRSSTTLQVRLADDTAYSVLDAQLRAQGTAPATSGANGTAGDIRYDADYIYVCTSANTWKRAAIATW